MNLQDYLSLPYQPEIIADPDVDGFVVFYPDLPGCITCASTMEKALVNAEDAKRAWIEAAIESGFTIKISD